LTDNLQWHGAALDKAMHPDEPSGPEGMGVCLTALDSRTQTVVDGQLETWGVGSELFEQAKKSLMDAGGPFDDDTVLAFCLRGAIGAAFTYGMASGIRLAALPKEDPTNG